MSHKAVPYEKGNLLYLKHVKQGTIGTTAYREVSAMFGCVAEESVDATPRVMDILRDIARANAPGRRSPILRPVGRIEIFCDDHTEQAQRRPQDRGLVLFDARDKPVLHVLHALIGYEGVGSSLTEDILRDVGVPDQIFRDIQKEFWQIRTTGTPYYIVIQSAPLGDGSLDWDWYSVVKPSLHNF